MITKVHHVGVVVRDIDVVLDTLGGPTQEASWAVLKPGGLLVATAQPPAAGRAEAAGARSRFIVTPPSGSVLEELATLVDAGIVRPVIGTELALADARKAHDAGTRGPGKTVLHVSAP